MKTLMSDQSRDIFTQLADAAPASAHSDFSNLSTAFESQSKQWTHTAANEVPGKDLERLFLENFSHEPEQQREQLKLALTAKLVLSTPDRVARENLPKSILAFYPAAFDRMAKTLIKRKENPSGKKMGLLAKYTRFVFALTIPCGAEEFDLNGCIPLSSCILAIKRERSLKSIFHYYRCKGTGVWFRSHTDTGFLDEFNEEGFDRYYLRIAELLKRREHVRGLVATSWFNDPQLLDISPRLSYLQTRPLDRGAHHMRHDSSEKDVEFATRKSETRRLLYNEGKYLPVMYSLIWGRKELISWANSV